MKYPVQMVWHDFHVRHIDNDSVVWAGQLAFVIDADGNRFQSPSLSLDDPWYHCLRCLPESRSRARLSIGAKFCPNCGTALDWDHLDRDPDSERDVGRDVTEKLRSGTTDGGLPPSPEDSP